MKSVNAVVFLYFFLCVFLQVLPRRKAPWGGAQRRPQATEWWDMFRDKSHTEGDERQQISTGFRIRRLNTNNAQMLDLSIASSSYLTESQYFTIPVTYNTNHLLCGTRLVPSNPRRY
jgi:hypothetical protein